MKRVDILKLLNCLGVNKTHISDNWVNSSCPLARYSHDGGMDRHPSFGIRINNRGESIYRCFTCSSAAPLSGLIHNLFVLKDMRWRDAMSIYDSCEVFSLSPINNNYGDELKIPKKPIPIPDYIVNKFPYIVSSNDFESNRCADFLYTVRGINYDTQKLFGIRYSPFRDRIVIFPRIDKSNVVWWMRARSRLNKSFFSITPSYFSTDEKWGDSSRLFGEQFLDSGPILIVESETDVLKLYDFGVYNVVATGGGVQKVQLDRLYHDVVILGFDADIAGFKNKVKAERILRNYSTLFYLDWKKAGAIDAGKLESKSEFDKVYNSKILL